VILGNSHNLFLAFGLTAYTGLVTGIGGLIAFLAKHTDSCILSAFFSSVLWFMFPMDLYQSCFFFLSFILSTHLTSICCFYCCPEKFCFLAMISRR